MLFGNGAGASLDEAFNMPSVAIKEQQSKITNIRNIVSKYENEGAPSQGTYQRLQVSQAPPVLNVPFGKSDFNKESNSTESGNLESTNNVTSVYSPLTQQRCNPDLGLLVDNIEKLLANPQIQTLLANRRSNRMAPPSFMDSLFTKENFGREISICVEIKKYLVALTLLIALYLLISLIINATTKK